MGPREGCGPLDLTAADHEVESVGIVAWTPAATQLLAQGGAHERALAAQESGRRGIHEDDARDRTGVVRREQPDVEPAERVADQQVGRRNPSGAQQAPQARNDIGAGARLGRGVTLAEVRTVIGARPRQLADGRCDGVPGLVGVAEPGVHDDGRASFPQQAR